MSDCHEIPFFSTFLQARRRPEVWRPVASVMPACPARGAQSLRAGSPRHLQSPRGCTHVFFQLRVTFGAIFRWRRRWQQRPERVSARSVARPARRDCCQMSAVFIAKFEIHCYTVTANEYSTDGAGRVTKFGIGVVEAADFLQTILNLELLQ